MNGLSVQINSHRPLPKPVEGAKSDQGEIEARIKDLLRGILEAEPLSDQPFMEARPTLLFKGPFNNLSPISTYQNQGEEGKKSTMAANFVLEVPRLCTHQA